MSDTSAIGWNRSSARRGSNDVADTFADAFKRYWAIILTVAGALLYAGGVYTSMRDQIAQLNSDLRAYMVEREGLLRDINGRFDRIESRVSRLESE